jgi:Uma2 family endonuclease
VDGNPPSLSQDVYYPTSDGKPMGETDQHRLEMQAFVLEVLEDLFAADPDVYVAGNNFVYFTEGAPEDCVSPDAYVVKGVARRPRDCYKVWEEGGKTPCVVVEVTSRKTHREDRAHKLEIYRDDLRVREYFLFDPRGEWVRERLRGFRLRKGVYSPIEPVKGRLPSKELGVDLLVKERHLRFLDPKTGAILPTLRERAEIERQRADDERRRADALADEVARLRAEIERRAGG